MSSAEETPDIDELIGFLRKIYACKISPELIIKYLDGLESTVISELLHDNLDLLLLSGNKGIDVARTIVQLILELPASDELRTELLRRKAELDLGRIYYRDEDNQFLKTQEYGVISGNDATITTMLDLGGGRFVTGDLSGGITIWESAYPPIYDPLRGHDGKVHVVRRMGENRILSFGADNKVRIWDIEQGKEIREFSLKDEILNAEVFDEDIVVIHYLLDYEEIEDIFRIETRLQRRVGLKGYRIGDKKELWTREFQVDEYSALLPIPDGRFMLFRSELEGYSSALLCVEASIIDPATGEVDSGFQELADCCERILYSSVEMPLVLHRFAGRFRSIHSNGDEIPMNDYLNELLLENYKPMLVEGPGLLFIDEESCVCVKGPLFDKENSRSYPLTEFSYHVHDGRYLSGVTGASIFEKSAGERAFLVYDLQSGERILSTPWRSSENSMPVKILSENLVLVSVPDSAVKLFDLDNGEEYSYRGVEASNSSISYGAMCINDSVLIPGDYGSITLIQRKKNKEVSSYSGHILDWILGARDNLLFVESSEEELIVYDTEKCEEINNLGRFRDGVGGLVHLADSVFCAWSPEDGLFVWDVRTGEKKYSASMKDFELTGVLVLRDGRLLGWGTRYSDGFEWVEARIAEFDIKTGEERELLRIREDRNPVSGTIPFVPINAIAGQCQELSDGRILVPPHGSIPYRDRTSFDILLLDRSDPENISSISLDGYTPSCIRELPGGVLMICTGYQAYKKEKRISRVFFRDMSDGELLYSSPEMEGHIIEIIEIAPNLVGGLQVDDTVSLFQLGRSIKYKGDKPFERVLTQHPDIIERNQPEKEIGRRGLLFRMPTHTSSTDFRWDQVWGRFRGREGVIIDENMVWVVGPESSYHSVSRLPMEKAFLFDHSIAVVSHDGRLGFLREFDFGK